MVASARAMHSDSDVAEATSFCAWENQLMAPPASMDTSPDIRTDRTIRVDPHAESLVSFLGVPPYMIPLSVVRASGTA